MGMEILSNSVPTLAWLGVSGGFLFARAYLMPAWASSTLLFNLASFGMIDELIIMGVQVHMLGYANVTVALRTAYDRWVDPMLDITGAKFQMKKVSEVFLPVSTQEA